MASPTTNLYPNPLSPDVDKDTEEFGLKVMRSCYNRWKSGYGGESYDSRLARFEKNRLYAAGKQPTEQFKDIVKVEGQIAVLNLDYSPLAIAVPLLNAKKDRYMERVERIKVKSSGPVSQDKKKKDKDKAKFKMNYGEAIQKLQQDSGMQLEEFSDDDPKSDKDLDIQFKTTYKQKEEIIMQLGLDLVFRQNEWTDVTKDQLISDLFNCGYGITQTELNGSGWIKTPRVKPEGFITSYSERPDFSDWQWQGQRFSMSIMEIRLRFPGKVSEEKLYELAESSIGKWGNSATWDCGEWSSSFTNALARPYDKFNVEIVDLYYKTLYNLTYEKKVNSFNREILKPATEVKEGKNYEKSNPYYVAYHGVWILDSEIVLQWGLAKNMLKPNNNLVECLSPYTIHMPNNHKCRNTPLTETMIPSIDLMQNIHMQTQKIIAMTAPDGYDIDIAGLSDIDMGKGVGVVSPMQLFAIYLQTGNQYYMSSEPDGDGKRVAPIVPKNHQYSNKLEQLENKWQAEYARLQRITGDNQLANGQITNQAVANSTLNDAREISDNASNYIYKAYLQIFKGTAKNAELLLLDKFFLMDDTFEGYNMALGEDDIAYMRSLGKEELGTLMFDTTIDASLDGSDQAKWDKRIEIALEQKQVTLADVAELEMIDDPTYRSYQLAQKVKEKQAADMQIAQANAKNNTAQAEAAANAKGKHDLDAIGAKHMAKMEEMSLQQKNDVLKQNMEFSGILKSKVAEAILSQPGAKISEIPAFIWEGLGITEEAQKQTVMNYMQGILQQQQAQQPQGQPQQDPNQQQAPPQGQDQQAA